MSYRRGQEDGAGEDKLISREGGKLLRRRGRGRHPRAPSSVPMAFARARHWKQHGWAEREAERGTIPSLCGTLEPGICRMGLPQQSRNGSVANVDGKQASCG